MPVFKWLVKWSVFRTQGIKGTAKCGLHDQSTRTDLTTQKDIRRVLGGKMKLVCSVWDYTCCREVENLNNA
jgi:hypothetical protein